jgi:hypothetical protein
LGWEDDVGLKLLYGIKNGEIEKLYKASQILGRINTVLTVAATVHSKSFTEAF